MKKQTIDRVHRLNQTRDVIIYKLIVKNTIEARILKLQEKKRALTKATIEDKQAIGKLSMKNILTLFRHDAKHAYSSDEFARSRNLNDDFMKMFVAGSEQLTAFRSQSRRAKKSVRRTSPMKDSVYGRRW